MKASMKYRVAAVFAASMIAVGVAAPSFADGDRPSYMKNWIDGDASSNWTDKNKDAVKTHVTFDSCTREFTASIRRTISGRPDPKVSSEHMDCASAPDAVRASDLPAAKYHFDVSGIGISHCVPALGCVYNKTSVPTLTIYW